MGCWFETCGFTNLPINEGDEVLWTIIKRVDRRKDDTDEGLRLEDIKSNDDGGTEPWTGRRGDEIMRPFDLWQPVAPFARGTYDDYGGVEMPEEEWDRYRKGRLEKQRVDLRRNPWGGNLRVNDRMFVLPPGMHLWMMRRDCFDALAGLPVPDWYDEKTLAEYEAVRWSKVRAAMQARIDAEKPLDWGFDTLGEMFGRIEAPEFHVYYMGVSMAGSIASKDGIDAAIEYLRPLMEIQRVFIGLDALRKTLTPTVGSGSQDWGADAHLHMAKYIQRVCQEYMEDFD